MHFDWKKFLLANTHLQLATKLSKTVGLIAKLRHCSSTYLAKYLPCVNLALFILWFDSMGTGIKDTFTKIVLPQKKFSDSYFLPIGTIMSFLFLLMQISCPLSPYLT